MDDIFKFLFSSDNHLGYMEKDPRRSMDSYLTFEECLRAARVDHDVDAVLLGGDLFHDSKPPLSSLVKTLSLLRKYVLGDKPVSFAMLSDPQTTFPTHPLPCANVQDPNLNVALPIFTIHGNHDDSVGGCSPIDVLAAPGLINFFGICNSVEDIVLRPILLQKGNTFIALYGLGHIRDERLHRCFRLKKLTFVRPKSVPSRRWFTILILHQNRGVRTSTSKAGILEQMLKGYGIDLVIWGNEHESLMEPHACDGFDVVQPGSTIVTSFGSGEGDGTPRQYGILEVRGIGYRVIPYRLRCVRPLVKRNVVLWQAQPSARSVEDVETYLKHVVEEMLDETDATVRELPDEVLQTHPSLRFPLMRLSVDYANPNGTSFPRPNVNRFGQQYVDVVANASELLATVKPRQEAEGEIQGPATPLPALPGMSLSVSDIRSKIAAAFGLSAKDACELLSEHELAGAIHSFVEKSDTSAISDKVAALLKGCQKAVWKDLRDVSGETTSGAIADRVTLLVRAHKNDVNEKATALDAEEKRTDVTHVGDILKRSETVLAAQVKEAANVDGATLFGDVAAAEVPVKRIRKPKVARADPNEKGVLRAPRKSAQAPTVAALPLAKASSAVATDILALWEQRQK